MSQGDILLRLVPQEPETVLRHLSTAPDLASYQDGHGYSLLHAAASYGHATLLQALVREYHVDPNLKDEDGETALFSVEEINMAQELIDLGTDATLTNNDGQTAAQKLDDEDEQPEVAAFLNGLSGDNAQEKQETGETDHASRPPPLPAGMKLELGTMAADEAGEEDPLFRQRIEELAARPDFHTDNGQQELRQLVTDAVSGLAAHKETTRRRLD